MPKMKTHSGAKKRFTRTGTGNSFSKAAAGTFSGRRILCAYAAFAGRVLFLFPRERMNTLLPYA